MSQDARLDEEQATQRRARILGLPYIDTSQIVQKTLYRLLDPDELEKLRVIPVAADDHYVNFGITNTTAHNTMQMLQQRFADRRVSFGLISETGFSEYMKLYKPPKKVEYRDIQITPTGSEQQLQSISQTLEQVRADDMLAYLVKQSYQLKASDIHLETGRDKVRIRFRVDGVLHPIAEISTEKYRQLMSSLAIAANISSNSPESQTGHINRETTLADGSRVTVNVRVETIPTSYGQDAVLRLFSFKSELLNLDNLGLSGYERQQIDDIIRHPNGLMLMVGPTGSGKTTTMYSILNELNNPERKIITLEDPIEYNIDGITQVPVVTQASDTNAKFAEKFKAVLRLDPDVIMVGEIRDLDTARTALQAALTGHLVLSTYHAYSAAAALSRMLDAIGQNPLFASAIRLVIAQRLVRRLDDATKQAYQPDEAVKNEIRRAFEHAPEGMDKPDVDNLTLYRPGKSDQNPFGYTGQFAIRELLVMNEAIQTILRLPANEVSTERIDQVARDSGMVTMLQDGILKAAAGLTSLEEIYRVVS